VEINSHIIDGRGLANEITARLTTTLASIKELHNLVPTLAIILVGLDPASLIYVQNKLRVGATAGMNAVKIHLPSDISNSQLLDEIDKLNNDDTINGIIIQLPLPKHVDQDAMLSKLDPKKDVDGFHPINVGYLHSATGDPFIPCTALGCLKLIKKYEPNLPGKNAVIIGRSNIVGKPLSALLVNEDCTVTICHSKTVDLAAITCKSDIVISAIGNPLFLKESYFSKNSIVIDVGITRLPGSNKIVGDVDFQNVHNKVRYITPVPGGVGPMTIACLLENTLKALLKQHHLHNTAT
jgi:methylenetetrahydrofolate dehydrogenase (NADP+)/methenyltetrahydrofolate cyclohydrolase